jgi:hypothetical protein
LILIFLDDLKKCNEYFWKTEGNEEKDEDDKKINENNEKNDD